MAEHDLMIYWLEKFSHYGLARLFSSPTDPTMVDLFMADLPDLAPTSPITREDAWAMYRKHYKDFWEAYPKWAYNN